MIFKQGSLMNLKISTLFFGLVFIFLIYLMWLMASPILGAIIFAGILGGAFYPLFLKLDAKLKIRRELTAILMCLLIFVVVFLPLIFIVFKLSQETIGLYQHLRNVLDDQSIHAFLFGDGPVKQVLTRVGDFFQVEINMNDIKVKLFGYVQSFSGVAFQVVNGWVSDILSFLFDFIIMILVMYALFSEGERLKAFILKLSPLPDEQELLILHKFNQMNYVTLVCNGVGGLIQGILAGIGFWIAGIQSIILWTAVMVVLAFIPLLGISIVYIPVTIYLILKGKVIAAVGLFIYCSAIALITENWFKPKFIGSKIQINSLFVLFCIIGGMSVFSMAGIFYGPLIGIIFLTAVDIYHENYAAVDDS